MTPGKPVCRKCGGPCKRGQNLLCADCKDDATQPKIKAIIDNEFDEPTARSTEKKKISRKKQVREFFPSMKTEERVHVAQCLVQVAQHELQTSLPLSAKKTLQLALMMLEDA